MQSLQSPFSSSLSFNTLGPLSPFPAPHHIQPLQTNLGLTTPTSPLASAAAMSPIPQTPGSSGSQSRGMTMAQVVTQSASGKTLGSPARPGAMVGVAFVV